MSIIIRLQNLPWEANSLDIRRYFQGLSIPDGGVHIVGGAKGDAFIAFSSDEDARQAMGRDGGMIKDSRIKLFLSSRNEMQKVIEQARNQTLGLKSSDPMPMPSTAPQSSGLVGIHSHQDLMSGANEGNNVPGLSSNLGTSHAGYAKNDFLRRSDKRDMARSLGDRSALDSLGRNVGSTGGSGASNRSRSRSPFGRGDSSHYSRHPDDDLSKMSAELMNNPMSGIHSIPLSNYANNLPPMRSGMDPLGPGGSGGGPNSMMSGRGYQEASLDTRLGSNGRSRLGPWSVDDSSGYSNYMSATNDGMKSERLVTNDKLAYSNLNQHGGSVINHGPNFCVELRGLSFNVVPRDIQEFFRPAGLYLPEEIIKIILDNRGYPTSCAIVQLSAERDFEAALTRNGCFMGDRRIEVIPESLPHSAVPGSAREEEMMRNRLGPQGIGSGAGSINDSPSQPGLPPSDLVVYMKGIPYNSCTNPDIQDFFHGLECTDIFFEVDPKTGKPAGNAYVEFAAKEDFNAALEMNMKHMGKRYIEIFPTNREDMNEARRVAMGGERHRQNFCVSVTNLPPAVTNRDLTDYFTELGAQPFAIHIMLKPNGFNAGEAFIEFLTRDQQTKALRRDGSMMGSHRISVKQVAYEVMRRIVGLPSNGPQSGPPSMDSMRPYPSHGDINDPRPRDGKGPRGRGRGGDHFRRGGREDRMSRRMASEGNHGGGASQPNFADPRCVVIAQNIPYRATNEDICVFFSDFNIGPESIMRRMNDKGQVAADCKIAFASPEDASRAVKLMHKKYLIGRPVFLRLAA